MKLLQILRLHKILSNLLSGREINQKNINDLKNQSLEELIQTKLK